MNDIEIQTKSITLGQFLKLVHCASTGGHAKIMLVKNQIKVNGENETRRGRKLYPDNVITIDGYGEFRIISSQEV